MKINNRLPIIISPANTVPFTPENFEKIKRQIAAKEETKPKVLTIGTQHEVENRLRTFRGLFFMLSTIYNNYASHALTDAQQYLSKEDQWPEVKKHYKDAVRVFDAYERYMRVNQAQKKFAMFCDVGDYAYTWSEMDRRDVMRNMERVAREKGERHSITAARVALAKYAFDFAVAFYDRYNGQLRERFGFSFAGAEYRRIRLGQAADRMSDIMSVICSRVTITDFEKDKECMAAIDKLFSRVGDHDNLIKFADVAINNNVDCLTEEEYKSYKESRRDFETINNNNVSERRMRK